ncbi:heme oxygenase [Brevibacterium sanguinis]|uniref:Heme oxygenase n=2 Tax=Brevibacterium TaxID=1696 RepID=A0A366IQ70_9MICO|nr:MULTISPECIES: biliverdin-producing heme oxygenase [Brevibacterium]RBP68167.1 heme oxygenase [Brevibacterium sanguinis]RBP74416.1 heme oxygenase [Brevibacterium celere]
MPSDFSARLREATATIHSDVENRGFVVDLMDGRLDARAYALLLTQYEVIYAELERRAAEFGAHPVFAPFADDRLDRHARIVHDLDRLRAGLDDPDPPVVEATGRYAERLRGLRSPEALLAHHYTRYLGDLSGGLAIGALMARHYGIEAEALTMWDFAEIGKTKPFKDAYRRRLDALAGTGGDEEAVIAEALVAFELNGEVLSEIADLTPSSSAA